MEPLAKKKKQQKQREKKLRDQTSHPDGIAKCKWPTLEVKDAIYVDECGCGAYSGPLTIGAVFLLPGFNLKGIHDSKKLKPHEHATRSLEMHTNDKIIFHIENVTNKELDFLGGLGNAWQEGVKRAVKHLQEKLEMLSIVATSVVLDGTRKVPLSLPVTSIKSADSLYLGVACASILAKNNRDSYMRSIAHQYPEFEIIFKNGKGYRHSQRHDDLLRNGVFTDLHRKTLTKMQCNAHLF